MSLRLLLEGLQKGVTGSLVNVVIEIVHACIEKFDDVDEVQNREIAGMKEMVLRSEERNAATLEAYRLAVRGQIDLIAKAVEVLGVRVSNVEEDPR